MQTRLQAVGATFSFFDGLNGSARIPPHEVRTCLWTTRRERISRCLRHVQKTEAQIAREAVTWGLDVNDLRQYDVVPNKLCFHTTWQHYACTVSHLLLIFEAYMANQVRAKFVPTSSL